MMVNIYNYMAYYRIDYVAYLILVALLDLFALAYQSRVCTLLAIGLAWLFLAYKAFEQIKKKRIGTEFFLIFATIIGLFGKQDTAIMIVLLIMLIAHYFELLIEQRTQKALTSLLKVIPEEVIVVHQQKESVLPSSAMQKGMHVRVKTGGRIAADGFVVDGHAFINEAALTGESATKEKNKGDQVFAGTFVESGSIVFQVDKVREETLFGKITTLLVEAEKRKAHVTVLTDKIVLIATPVLLIFIVIIWFLTNNTNVVITLLIFGSPLELSLVTPLAILSGSFAAFRKGVLVKGGQALEFFAKADTIIFDKTGTLTLGEPTVVAVQTYDNRYTIEDVLQLAGISEQRSDHVVAKAIFKKARELNLIIPQPETYYSLVGHGVEITYQGKRYFFGNKHFIEAPEHANSHVPPSLLENTHQESLQSIFYLATDGKVIGLLQVVDTIRQDAQLTIQNLQKSGISSIFLVSGDSQIVTQRIAQQLGIEHAYGNVFPDQKLEIIDNLQKKGHIVAMVGDGINDAAALKQADVGIALGAMGMEPAIEAADIVLITNDLDKIFFLRRLAHKVFRTIKQNLLIGFLLLHVLGFILTLNHLVTPVQAAFFHAISDVLIILNASRLMFFAL